MLRRYRSPTPSAPVSGISEFGYSPIPPLPGMHPLLGGFLKTPQVETAVDEGDVSEGRRELADQPPGSWIVLFAEKAHIIA